MTLHLLPDSLLRHILSFNIGEGQPVPPRGNPWYVLSKRLVTFWYVFRFVSNTSDKAMSEMAETFKTHRPWLTHVDLSRCVKITEGCLSTNLGFVPLLTSLNLSRVPQAGEAFHQALGNSHKPYGWYKGLTHLDVSKSPNDDTIGNPDKLVTTLVSYPYLQHLNLAHHTGLTDAGAITIGNSCSHMEVLIMTGNTGVTIDGFVWLAIKCIKITTLCVASTKICDNGVGEFTRRSTNLTELDVGHCDCLTDIGMKMIAEVKGMKSLSLRGIWNRGQFTTNGVVSVIFGCSSLDLLDALDCTEVNAEYIEENILPHVRACGRLGTYLLSRHEEGQYRVYRQLTPRSPMHTPWLPAAWFTTVRSNDHNPSLVNYFPANKADYVQSRGAEPPYGMYNLEWTLN